MVTTTSARHDPEYVWIKKEGRLDTTNVGFLFDANAIRRERIEPHEIGRSESGLSIGGFKKIISLGTIGVLLQSIGLFWLLSSVGLAVPWYSIFPLIIMIVGGVFIVREDIHDKDRIRSVAYNDGCYHQRN